MIDANFSAMGSSGGCAGTARIRRISGIILIVVAIASSAAHSLRRQVRRPSCSSPRSERDPPTRRSSSDRCSAELAELRLHGEASSIAELLGPQAPRPGILDRGKNGGAARGADRDGARRLSRRPVQGMPKKTCRPRYADQAQPRLVGARWVEFELTYNAVRQLAVAQAQNGRADESVATMMDVIRMSSAPISQSKLRTREPRSCQGRAEARADDGARFLDRQRQRQPRCDLRRRRVPRHRKVAIGDLVPGVRRNVSFRSDGWTTIRDPRPA